MAIICQLFSNWKTSVYFIQQESFRWELCTWSVFIINIISFTHLLHFYIYFILYSLAKAVSFAVKQNKTKSLQLLLDLGQDPDDMVDRPVSCVSGVELSAIQAAVLAENTDCISVLFHNGATIVRGVSFAAKQNKTKSLQLLLDLGQDPDDMVDRPVATLYYK